MNAPGRTALRLSLLVLAVVVAVTLLVAQDAQPRRGFSIAITEPANQEVILGKTKLAADVKIDDPTMIDHVEFVVGDEVVFVDREAPYECFHDFGEESRSWIIRAVASRFRRTRRTRVAIRSRSQSTNDFESGCVRSSSTSR